MTEYRYRDATKLWDYDHTTSRNEDGRIQILKENFRMKPEVIEWLDDQAIPYEVDVTTGTSLHIPDPDHAMSFKIRWI